MPRDGMVSDSALGKVMDASGLPGTGERQARVRQGGREEVGREEVGREWAWRSRAGRSDWDPNAEDANKHYGI
ncbi:hypothetical protein E2C01_090844 [Portunus trituberculatus]|uniref:Uncharacterized protein n=1 Tax=Portunus trituberculatus TaxID=210409 RepID=A0A5B7JLZ9_PORTR|nr:hypothetical protein [Portunus trituberculatus]